MPKYKLKTNVSKRQLYRRVAAEVQQIFTDVTINQNDVSVTINQNNISDLFSVSSSEENVIAISTKDNNVQSNVDLSGNEISLNSYIDDEDNFFINSHIVHQSVNNNPGQGPNTENERKDLPSQLRNWATSERVTHSAVKSLLHILAPYHPELPLDSRTLLHTPLNFKSIKTLDSGQYIHLGLERALKLFLEKNKIIEDTISVSFNVDGIPLYNSSVIQAWPLLGLIKNIENQRPFAVGIFCGKSKPTPLSLYFEEFINECNALKEGFLFNGKTFLFKIHSFVCDAPAKAFIKCIKSPGGYSCCDRCFEYGDYVNGRVVFKDLGARKRTDDSFRAEEDEDHHVGISPLISLNINMVNDFPIDYMHNVCLGVMRKLLNYWVGGNLHVRLPSRLITLISNNLLSSKEYIPTEINRKPRALSELPRFKATEFRTFLLYTGIVVLKDIVDAGIYNHFLLLHSAIASLMLANATLFIQMNCELASRILVTFIEHGKKLYGPEFLIYNVHVLSHLSEDVLRFGSLDTFSAFPFENYLGQIKALIKSTTKPLQQICRRISELEYASLNSQNEKSRVKFSVEHCDGPCLSNEFQKQYKKISLISNYILSTYSYSKADAFCFTEDCVIQIENILTNNNQQEIKLIGRHFTSLSSFYDYPFDSRHLNIFLVSCLSEEMRMWSLSDIKGKCMILPCKNNLVSVPLFHTCQI